MKTVTMLWYYMSQASGGRIQSTGNCKCQWAVVKLYKQISTCSFPSSSFTTELLLTRISPFSVGDRRYANSVGQNSQDRCVNRYLWRCTFSASRDEACQDREIGSTWQNVFTALSLQRITTTQNAPALELMAIAIEWSCVRKKHAGWLVVAYAQS